METITLLPLYHRNLDCIGIYFEYSSALNRGLRKLSNANWSKTHGCWWMPCTKENYDALTIAISGKAKLQTTALSTFLINRKKHPVIAAIKQSTPVSSKPIITAPPTVKKWAMQISSENNETLRLFTQHLELKAYSASTIRTYTNELIQFLNTIGKKPAVEFSAARIKDYLQYCFVTLHLSEATLHSRINALKFYYEQVLGKEKFFWEIPRPKKPDQLPKVLSEKEIGRMFNAITNIKHKAILFTAYSAGLRVSEVVNLKIKDVDSERMQLFIEKAKGKKDRYVGLGILLLDVLRAYLKTCHPLPKTYVFENPQRPGEPYSSRSAQQIFQTAKEKAMINKVVGIHSLRHSFATHLLEKGIDIRYIKDLLGHLNIKTTERYLHVKKETLINIPNVLDELHKSFTLDW
jgi:site-specific recombinase XerD